MKSIAIIACFIGRVHSYFNLWLKSAAANPDIDFYLVGKMNLEDYDLPPNCYVKPFTLEELENEIRIKLKEPNAVIGIPYKTGDYRPMFGEVFQDWLKNYDIWGYCDIDVVFGNLRKFLTDDKLDVYDKIYPLGHLSLYRNTPEVNARWRLPDARYDIQTVLTSPEVFAFDEWRGIHNIYMRNKFPFYRKVEFANPSSECHRFLFKNRSDPKYERNPDNYSQMCFYWENGSLFRAYNAGNGINPKICIDEFAYMHFMRRKFPVPSKEVVESQAFFCSPDGFFVKEHLGIPSLQEIKKFNPLPFGGVLGEKLLLMYARMVRWKKRFISRLMKKKGTFASRDEKLHESRKW